MRVFTSCTDKNPTPSVASSGLCPKSDGTSTAGMVPISGPIAGAPESRPFLVSTFDSTSGFEPTDQELQAAPHNANSKHKQRLLVTHTTHLPKKIKAYTRTARRPTNLSRALARPTRPRAARPSPILCRTDRTIPPGPALPRRPTGTTSKGRGCGGGRGRWCSRRDELIEAWEINDEQTHFTDPSRRDGRRRMRLWSGRR